MTRALAFLREKIWGKNLGYKRLQVAFHVKELYPLKNGLLILAVSPSSGAGNPLTVKARMIPGDDGSQF